MVKYILQGTYSLGECELKRNRWACADERSATSDGNSPLDLNRRENKMKKILAITMLVMVAFVLSLSSSSVAFAEVPDEINLFQNVTSDTAYGFENPFLDGHNLIQEYFKPGNTIYLVLHPEFKPDADNPNTATEVMAIARISVWNPDLGPDGGYDDDLLDGTICIIPASYLMYTGSGEDRPYLRIAFTLWKYNLATGAFIDSETRQAYFKVPE